MKRSSIVPQIKRAHIGYRDQAFKINDIKVPTFGYFSLWENQGEKTNNNGKMYTNNVYLAIV